MQLDYDSDKPLFKQIAEGIENEILSGNYTEGSKIPSMNELSARYHINPTTALKSVELLTREGILFKKRGTGTFVSEHALKSLYDKRKRYFFETYITDMLSEAKRLSLTKEDVIDLIDWE